MVGKMKRTVSVLLAVMLVAGIFTALPITTASAADVTDTLDRAFTGVTKNSSTYSLWSGKTGTSGAVYAGQSAGGYDSIQIRSNNSNSGIVTTKSGGKAKKVTVTWNTNTADGRTLDIYGKNTAYSAATDLYSSAAATKGTKLGSIVYGTSTELTISGDYEYIGLRSNSNAMYLSEINITWGSGYTVTWKDGNGTIKETDTDIASGSRPEYNGETPTKDSDENYSYIFNDKWSDGTHIYTTENLPDVTTNVIYTAQFDAVPLPEYTVYWYADEECEDLLDEEIYKEGATPSYKGEAPAKDADDTYSYYFNNTWKDFMTGDVYSSSDMPTVTDDAIYIAQYNQNLISKYTVTWADYNGTEIVSERYNKNSVPEFKEDIPTRQSDENYSYTFAGWTPAITAVTKDVTYTAVYTATPINMTGFIIRTDSDTEYDLAGKYYTYSNTTAQFADNGAFSEAYVAYDIIQLGGVDIAGINKPSNSEYAHTVYVTGDGTSEHPYVFTPNYIYQKNASKISEGAQADVTSGNIIPGDGFKGFTRVKVGQSNYIRFLQNMEKGDLLCSAGYMGVGATTYGNSYSGVSASPCTFLSGNDTLYYLGYIADAYNFSEEVPYGTFGEPAPTYTVTWNNYNDTELDSETYYEGATPSYKGETPTREDEDYNYTFSGWSDGTDTYGVDDVLPAVNGDVTFTAQFTRTPKPTFTVTWYDGDLNELSVETYKQGQKPTYKGSTPTKDPTSSARYEFNNSWYDINNDVSYSADDIPNVTDDAEYIAEFDTINTYIVWWVNGNDTILEETYDEGEIPEYSGETPEKASEGGHVYTFSGWDPEPAPIYEDTMYTAQFSTEYEIMWVDGNDDELYTDSVTSGTRPVYSGSDPTKDADQTYRYVFNGKWAAEDGTEYLPGEIPLVSGDAIYTACFDSIKLHPYVIWCNYDDEMLDGEEYYEGDTPVYNGETPTKPNAYEGAFYYAYEFSGWSPDPAPLTDDVVYTAQFNKVRLYSITWEDSDGTVLKTEWVKEGETPSYGSTPSKADDETYSYTFTEWSPEITAASEDMTYTAQYSQTKLHPTVMWENYNSSVLDYETTYNYGDVPTYKKDTPTWTDSEYYYTFIGWSSDGGTTVYGINEVLPALYDDTVYVAQYSVTAKPEYTVTWVEHDKTTNVTYKEGAIPSYDGTPEKYFEGVWRYEFLKWNDGTNDYYAEDTLPPVSGNTTYTAIYEHEALRDCTVRWLNYNGDVLEEEVVKEGTVASYKGVSEPTHAGDGEHTYLFSGWSPEPGVILGDTDFTAVFVQTSPTTMGIVPTNEDKTYTMLEDKWVLKNPDDEYPTYFGGNGKFELDGNKLMLADVQVATISTGSGKVFANTVYVTGLGTYEDPYVFYPNYKYGTGTEVNFGNGTKVNLSDINPGDQFTGTTSITVGSNTPTNNITFMAEPDVKMPTANGYIGVGAEKYGYAYSGNEATEHNGHGPYEFNVESVNYSNTLYYHGLNADGDSHIFSAANNISTRNDFIGVYGSGDWIIGWHNWDDSELYPDEYYEDGEMPKYKGDTPTRPEDDTYTYVFGGWDHMLIPVTHNFVYKAKFIEIPKDPSQPISDIEWIFPTDGVKTYEMEHMYYLYNNEIKEFPGDGELTDDGEHVYFCGETVADIGVTFSHEKMTAEFIHTVFVSGTGKHSDPFVFHPNYNFSSTMSTIGNGTTVYLGDSPANDSVKGYPGDTFQGNSRIKIDYSPIRFLPDDTYHTGQYRFVGVGTENYGYEYDQHGASPYTYTSNEKKLYYHGEDDYGYVFAEYPAEYQQGFGDPETFTVTWKNHDGTVIEEDTCYYDEIPSYDRATPTKAAYSRFTFTFSGWNDGENDYASDSLPNVTSDVTYTAIFDENSKLFTGHSLTLDGKIGVNFFLDVTQAEIDTGSGVVVKFDWTVVGEKQHSEFKLDNAKYIYDEPSGKIYYKATCWVPAAEMSYQLHATAYINGVLQSETKDYSVRDYGMKIINNSDKYDSDLVTLVKEMLNYGAKAQIAFERTEVILANSEVTGYEMKDITAEDITAQKSDMKENTEETLGLKYQGTSIVYLTDTTLRHYYSIVDQTKYNAVKGTANFDYGAKGNVIYYEVKNVEAANLDKVYTFTIGGLSYDYSVLDYSKLVLASNLSQAEKELAKATYWYNDAANTYFDKINQSGGNG